MKKSIAKFLTISVVVLLITTLSHPLPATSKTANENKALLISIDGAIGPATKDYFIHALVHAENIQASLLIIQLNTPGGLDSSMRDINSAILSSTIPIAIYVAPSGARAASAGTYMLYASHIAAMAPATNLGAATPVQIGGFSPTSPKSEPIGQENTPTPVAEEPKTLSDKSINDATAYIRGLAQLRGRNADWARKAVIQAATLTAQEALKLNVITILATDLSDLLVQLHGKTIRLQQNDVRLDTQGIILHRYEPDWRTQLLSILTDPNVAYLLMLLGVYGLIFEFSNPGGVIPGIIGGICLLLALFAFQTLPINYAGFGLILLGLAFMVAEAFVPSFGALGIGGVTAFVFGSIILLDTNAPGFGVSKPIIGTLALVSSILFTLVLVLALKARRRPVVSGQEELIGAIAEALDNFNDQGYVHLHGENWCATSASPIRKGQQVIVTERRGLVLTVAPHINNQKEYAE